MQRTSGNLSQFLEKSARADPENFPPFPARRHGLQLRIYTRMRQVERVRNRRHGLKADVVLSVGSVHDGDRILWPVSDLDPLFFAFYTEPREAIGIAHKIAEDIVQLACLQPVRILERKRLPGSGGNQVPVEQ